MSCNFDNDKRVGSFAEYLLAGIFNKADIPSKVLGGRDEPDVVSEDFSTEVKHDFSFAITGNVAVEFFNSGRNPRKSGICSTTSELWAFVIERPPGHHEVWLTSSRILRELVEAEVAGNYLSGSPIGDVRYQVGDRNASVVLYKADALFDYCFHRIDHLEPSEVKALVDDLCRGNNIACDAGYLA